MRTTPIIFQLPCMSPRDRARLADQGQTAEQVETLLKTQEPPAAPKTATNDAPSITVHADPNISDNAPATPSFTVNDPSVNLATARDMDRWNFNENNSPQPQAAADAFDFNALPLQNNFTWEMIGLGLEEPLPPQESIDELLDSLLSSSSCAVSRLETDTPL